MSKLAFLGKRTKFVFASGLIAIMAIAGFSLNVIPRAVAASCDKVNIVYCGLTGSDVNGYIGSVKQLYAANSNNGYTDIQQMFEWGGFSGAVTSGMNTSNTKVGTLTKDGVITVDGTTVATGTQISARFTSGAGFTQVKSGVWSRATTVSMANASDQVLIVFDANGKAIAGMVIRCGNTLQFTATPPPASYGCTAILPTKLSRLEWSFHMDAYAKNASIDSFTYDFGDGSAKVTTGDTAKHSYTKSGTYTVVVIANFSANGHSYRSTCKYSITVEKPIYKCEQLTGPNKDLAYTFVATATTTEGAALLSGDFDFGDGNTATGQKAVGNTVTVQHTYAKEGTYSVGATLKFTVDGATATAATCRASVTPKQPAKPECKPGIPVGDARCTPCQYDVNLTSDDTRCKPSVLPATTTLPNTGAGNVVLLSLAALVGGFLFYRHRIFMKHKHAFESAEVGGLPLPLADPLSDQPLDGTPLSGEPVRSTLRHRRQF